MQKKFVLLRKNNLCQRKSKQASSQFKREIVTKKKHEENI